MKYQELHNLLTEGLGTVYHATNISNASKILNDDCFELSPAIGAGSEINLSKGKFYFLSTMRSITSRYMTSDRGKVSYINKNVYFVLDADKLKTNMKSTPVDYWNTDNFTENEERFLSDKDKLCSFHKYIKSIHVLINQRMKDNMEDQPKYMRQVMTDLQTLVWKVKKYEIPLYVYTEIQNYITGKKGISFQKYLEQNNLNIGGDNYDKDNYKDLNWDRIHQTSKHHKSPLDYVLDFYSGDKIPTKTYRKLTGAFWGGVDGLYARDFISMLGDDVHASRRSNGVKHRDKVKLFIDIMKKNKIKSIPEFVKKVFYPDLKKTFKM